MEPKIAVIAGQIDEYDKEFKKFEQENDITEKHVSSSLVPMPNPNYHKTLSPNVQPVILVPMISAVVYATPKIKE